MAMNLRVAKRIAKLAIHANQTVLFLGSPGIGKTSCVRQIAEELGICCNVYEASNLDPTDVRGVIVPVNGYSRFTKSPLMPMVENGERGILLIDDLTSTVPSVQLALSALLLERRLGEHPLPPGWVPMATANYITDDSGAGRLLANIMDRMLIVNVVADVSIWVYDFAIPNDLHPAVIGFVQFRPQFFNTFSKRSNHRIEEGKTFTTPRSYARLSAILKEAEQSDPALLLDAEIRRNLLVTAIDPAVAVEFDQYYAHVRHIEKALLTFAKEGTLPDFNDQMLLYAFVSALPSLPENHLIKAELRDISSLLDHICKFCCDYTNVPPDLRLSILIALKKRYKNELVMLPNYTKALIHFQKELSSYDF